MWLPHFFPIFVFCRFKLQESIYSAYKNFRRKTRSHNYYQSLQCSNTDMVQLRRKRHVGFFLIKVDVGFFIEDFAYVKKLPWRNQNFLSVRPPLSRSLRFYKIMFASLWPCSIMTQHDKRFLGIILILLFAVWEKLTVNIWAAIGSCNDHIEQFQYLQSDQVIKMWQHIYECMMSVE